MPSDPARSDASAGERELDALLATQTAGPRWQRPEDRRFSPELIAALNAVDRPSRIIDREIGYITGAGQIYGDPTNGHGYPHYTANVDAALTLVPDGMNYILGRGRARTDEPLFGAQILDGEAVIADGETDGGLALAICIASLRARAAAP